MRNFLLQLFQGYPLGPSPTGYPPINRFGVAESCQRHAISQPSGSDSGFRLIDCIPTFDSQTAHFCSPKLRRQTEEDLEGSPLFDFDFPSTARMRLPGSSRFSKEGTTHRIVLGFNLDSRSQGDFHKLFSPAGSPHLDRAISFLKSLHTSATRLPANSLGLKILPLSCCSPSIKFQNFSVPP